MRNTLLWPAAVALLGCSAYAQATTLPADSLVCEAAGPASFVAGQEGLASKPGGEILGWAKSNLSKMQVLQRDPKQNEAFRSINQQVMTLLQGLVDNCVGRSVSHQRRTEPRGKRLDARCWRAGCGEVRSRASA